MGFLLSPGCIAGQVSMYAVSVFISFPHSRYTKHSVKLGSTTGVEDRGDQVDCAAKIQRLTRILVRDW